MKIYFGDAAGENVVTGQSYSITLNSPSFSSSSPSCLMFNYAPYVDSSELRLACIDSYGVYTEKLLRKFLDPSLLQQALQVFNGLQSSFSVDIDPITPIFKECSVVLKLSSSHTGTAAVLNNITLVTGKCLQAIKGEKSCM